MVIFLYLGHSGILVHIKGGIFFFLLFGGDLWCSQTGDHPQEDLAKSGYRPDMRTENCISAKYYAWVGAGSVWASDLILFIPSSQAHVFRCSHNHVHVDESNCWWNESSQLHCFSIGLFKHGVLQVAGCFVFPYDFWSIEWVVLVNNLWSTLLYSRDLSFKHNLWRSTLATLTLIILFSKTLEFSKRNLFFQRTKWSEGKNEIFKICQNENFKIN